MKLDENYWVSFHFLSLLILCCFCYNIWSLGEPQLSVSTIIVITTLVQRHPKQLVSTLTMSLLQIYVFQGLGYVTHCDWIFSLFFYVLFHLCFLYICWSTKGNVLPSRFVRPPAFFLIFQLNKHILKQVNICDVDFPLLYFITIKRVVINVF